MELTPWDLWPTPKSGAPAPVAFLMASSSLGRRRAVGSAFYTQTSRHIDPYAALRAVWHRSTDYLCHFAVISRGSETLTNWPLGTQLATRLTRRFHRVYSETTRASRQLPGKKNTQKTSRKNRPQNDWEPSWREQKKKKFTHGLSVQVIPKLALPSVNPTSGCRQHLIHPSSPTCSWPGSGHLLKGALLHLPPTQGAPSCTLVLVAIGLSRYLVKAFQ